MQGAAGLLRAQQRLPVGQHGSGNCACLGCTTPYSHVNSTPRPPCSPVSSCLCRVSLQAPLSLNRKRADKLPTKARPGPGWLHPALTCPYSHCCLQSSGPFLGHQAFRSVREVCLSLHYCSHVGAHQEGKMVNIARPSPCEKRIINVAGCFPVFLALPVWLCVTLLL